jgi:hypothetical protein
MMPKACQSTMSAIFSAVLTDFYFESDFVCHIDKKEPVLT